MLAALEAGRRLRARANLEESLARKLAQDLEALGAVVVVGLHIPGSSHGNAAVAGSGNAAVTPRLISAPAVPPEQLVTFATSLTLATLDGEDAEETAVHVPLSRAEPTEASLTPLPLAGASAPTPRPSPSRDIFLPPDAGDQALELVERPSRQGKMAPQSAPPMPSSRAVPVRSPTLEAPAVSGAADGIPPGMLPMAELARPGVLELATRHPRGRWVASLLLGLVVGFLVAQLYASFAEDQIDDQVAELARAPAPTTNTDHALLMEQYDLAEKRVRRLRSRMLAVTAVVWLASGAAAAAVYWRLTARDSLARAAA